MVHFFDTSALVKRYYEERGSETVDEIVESDEVRVVISSLSVIETVSAFRRKLNTGELARTDAETLISLFFDEALDQFVIVPMEEAVLQFSFDLVLEDDLRTLDSLQLSAAMATDAEVEDLVFVCADSELVSVAQAHDLETVNPT